MISFLMPVILLCTVIAAVGLGILAAYAAIFAILHAFRHPAPQPAPARSRLVLVPTQSHASGD